MKLMTTNLPLGNNITLRALKTDRFKTGCFSVNFLRPHDAQTAGLDALLPSVLLAGTEHYPNIQSISTHLDELYGASFGTLIRRKGEIKLLGFYADFIEDAFLPEGEAVLAPIIDFLAEVLYHPLTENGCFCARFVEAEKQNLINAIESNLNDKRAYATAQMLKTMCAGEAFGVPRLGTVEAVRAITPESLWAHYQTLLRTSRIEVFYAGRKSPEEAAQMLRPAFEGRGAQTCVSAATQIVRRAEKCKECSEAMDVTQGKLVIGLRTGITVTDPEFPALVLLNAVYGAGTTSKLFVNVREKLSVCYYASSSIEKYKGVMLISSGIAFENYQRAKDAILAELEACRAGDISSLELESARRQVLSSLRAAQDAPTQLDDFYLGMALAGGKDIPELMQCIAALTVEEVSAAARSLSVDTIYFLKGVDA